MGEPVPGAGGLEARLRSALGEAGHGAVEATSARSSAARTMVLSGLRQRRLRRLQLTGVAAALVLGLAVSLPQVIGGGSPAPSGAQGHHGAASQASASPASGRVSSTSKGTGGPGPTSGGGANAYAAQNAPARAPAASARCRFGGEAAVVCGTIATGGAAPRLAAAAASLERSVNETGAVATMAPAAGTRHVPQRSVRAGRTIAVTLPVLPDGRHWTVPVIAGRPTFHGSGPPVRVRAAGGHGGAQRFEVITHVPVTIVLDARATPTATPTATKDEPAAVWALELKVEGT